MDITEIILLNPFIIVANSLYLFTFTFITIIFIDLKYLKFVSKEINLNNLNDKYIPFFFNILPVQISIQLISILNYLVSIYISKIEGIKLGITVFLAEIMLCIYVYCIARILGGKSPNITKGTYLYSIFAFMSVALLITFFYYLKIANIIK